MNARAADFINTELQFNSIIFFKGPDGLEHIIRPKSVRINLTLRVTTFPFFFRILWNTMFSLFLRIFLMELWVDGQKFSSNRFATLDMVEMLTCFCISFYAYKSSFEQQSSVVLLFFMWSAEDSVFVRFKFCPWPPSRLIILYFVTPDNRILNPFRITSSLKSIALFNSYWGVSCSMLEIILLMVKHGEWCGSPVRNFFDNEICKGQN